VAERDQNGRFAPGNRGGPGRPRKAREEKYLDILVAACTPDEWEQVCRVAIARARAGDSRAREWLANYIIGKPIEKHEVTGPEGEGLRILVEYANSPIVSPELPSGAGED
jgi:hypothetical protein